MVIGGGPAGLGGKSAGVWADESGRVRIAGAVRYEGQHILTACGDVLMCSNEHSQRRCVALS